MKDNFKIAVDFADSIKRLRNKHILQIVLFGSVARGEDTPASDIDIAIIHNLDNLETLKSRIHKFQNEKIQASYFHIKQLPKETEIMSALTGEGILLYGKPINVKIDKKGIMPKVLIVYDTSEISKSERMKLNRALHGGLSKSRYKKRQYVSKMTGILEEKGIQKLAKAVLLAEPKKAAKVVRTLKLYGVKFRETSVWV